MFKGKIVTEIVGKAITAIIGIILFDDPFSIGVVIGVGLIILGIHNKKYLPKS